MPPRSVRSGAAGVFAWPMGQPLHENRYAHDMSGHSAVSPLATQGTAWRLNEGHRFRILGNLCAASNRDRTRRLISPTMRTERDDS